MKMTYRIKSDRGLAKALQKLPPEMSREVADVVQGHAQSLAADMRARAPVNTGLLRSSIKVRKSMKGLFARVGAFPVSRKAAERSGRTVKLKSTKSYKIFYARFIEFGTVGRVTKSGASRGKIPARPFVFNAWRSRRYNVKIDILEKARDVLRRNAADGKMT